jgi:pimeloyl-ACP methyl ester carboxylesterase
MRPIFLALCMTVCGLTVGCSETKSHSPAATTAQTPATPTETPRVVGKLVPMEPVSGAEGSSYAYYLPKNYNPAKRLPFVIFFDSHGRGKDPVHQYESLADQYGMLLVGSNNSKNGQQPLEGVAIYDEILKDLAQKFSIDRTRITVSGFSGGGRVAGSLGQLRPEISSVISCSAGFQTRFNDKFNYYAIVGKKDFNYQELRQLEDKLDAGYEPHYIHYWDGGHEWPSVAVMRDAFEFVTLREMKVGKPGVDSLVAEVRGRFVEQLKGSMSAMARWRAHKLFIIGIDSLADIMQEKQALEKIHSSPAWVSERAAETKLTAEEMALRNEYVSRIATGTVDDWRGFVAKLSPSGKPEGSEAYFMHHRVLNFLSLNTYFQVDGALKAGANADAEHFLQIYALVDPTNAEGPYLMAQVHQRLNRRAEALKSLQAAQALGFKDADRMAADPEFAGLNSDPVFVALLAKMRAE